MPPSRPAFVVRRVSPKTLLGGGTIAGIDATGTAENVGDDPELAAIVAALRAEEFAGATAARVGASSNVREDVAETLLARLAEDGRAIRLAKPLAYVDAELVASLVERVSEKLRLSESETPWLVGVTGLALSRALAVGEAVLMRILAVAIEDGRIAYRGGYYATPEFVPQLNADQRAFFDRAFAGAGGAELAPVAYEELQTAIRTTKICP